MDATMNIQFHSSPELKAFIYQQVLDFQPFVTPDTTLGVVLDEVESNRLLHAGADWETEPLRITLVMKDGEAKISAVGEGENVYEAIADAKSQLLNHLSVVQDSMISSQERAQEIYETLHRPTLH